jgi:hypothetical protein
MGSAGQSPEQREIHMHVMPFFFISYNVFEARLNADR